MNDFITNFFVIAFFLVLLIPIYGITHMILSLTGKIRPMGVAQRIIWIFLWVVAVCTAVPLGFTIAEYHNEYIYQTVVPDETTNYQGIEMSPQDKKFLRKGGWNLIKAENCDHYTYRGYYNGNHNMRFMDVHNENCEEVFQAERKEAVKPGVYRLDCAVRTEGPGPCVYVHGDSIKLMSMPVYENQDGRPDMGWVDVCIDNIVVSGDSIAYGVSSDESFTGKPCRAQWFSATDFKLTRIADLTKKK